MNSGGFSNQVFGGWQLTWTQTMQSGPPFNVSFAGSPNRYLPGMVRPNAVLPAEQMVVDDYTVGNRFPLAAQNNYFNNSAFAYPAAFTPGTMGRNVVESPGLRWTQLSISKDFRITENVRFSLRWDCNNPTKEPQLADPGAVYNLQNLAQFGRFAGIGRGSFSDIGTARMHHVLVGRFQW
jgi:hypothetical protein